MFQNRTLAAAMVVAGLLAAGSSSAALAGAVPGPQSGSGEQVDAFSTTYYYVEFMAGDVAEVSVVGDGDTDLDLYVYDENGNLIASDTDLSDACVCQWQPRWTGTFRIEVRNLGGVYNVYDLETN